MNQRQFLSFIFELMNELSFSEKSVVVLNAVENNLQISNEKPIIAHERFLTISNQFENFDDAAQYFISTAQAYRRIK